MRLSTACGCIAFGAVAGVVLLALAAHIASEYFDVNLVNI